MFIRPELRKGDIELRLRAPASIIQTLDLVAQATGLTRQDVVLLALDAYCQETIHVSKVVGRVPEPQWNACGISAETKRTGGTK
jgi:hypothetical protein